MKIHSDVLTEAKNGDAVLRGFFAATEYQIGEKICPRCDKLFPFKVDPHSRVKFCVHCLKTGGMWSRGM